ncbi:hypothetical protein B6V73_00035 [Thioclava sp. JM3]|uniref:hypothetical protein n=1 Tax=Thioclava sp. JM3 TaxID=1973004 RepID=UPI000B549478|nr:hypothetical protein [Thioclava sp. JM3]OWY18244.1 hypothetical protein B6V73_00035 [Thioclava sp. JM3]
MTEAKREKIKLRAAYLNGLALIFFGIGGFGPAFALLNTFQWKNLIVALVWLWAGGMSSWELHQLAQRKLDELSVTEE